jgi:hypothetical protein
MSETCRVEFAEFPIVRTSQELFTAAGRLAVANHTYELQPDPSLFRWAEAIPYDDNVDPLSQPIVRALRVALEASNPHISWGFGGEEDEPFSLVVSAEDGIPHHRDIGMHTDPAPSVWAVGVNCHGTDLIAGGGGVEITCATPTSHYTGSEEEREYLTLLLRKGLTDPLLVRPDSFSRARLEHGGYVAFTRLVPGQMSQLHDCVSLTSERISRSWFLDGVFKQAYRTAT